MPISIIVIPETEPLKNLTSKLGTIKSASLANAGVTLATPRVSADHNHFDVPRNRMSNSLPTC